MAIFESSSSSPVHGKIGRRGVNVLLATIGMGLLTWVILHSRHTAIFQQLTALRYALPIVVVLSLIRLLLQSLTWSGALRSEGLEVGIPRLMGIRLAAQAMGYLTIFGPLISEPMKINLLRTPVTATTTATFLDNGIYWFTSALVGIAGCACIGLVKAHGATSALAFSVAFVVILVCIARRKSVLSSIVGPLGERSPSWLNKGAQIESSIREVRARKPQLVRRMFWFDVACQVLLLSEVVVVLWSLRLPLHLLTVFAIEGLTRGVKMMTGFVPARLGADEGGAMSAFAASGLSPALGLALALTRRMRDFSWALVGLAWLAWRSHSPGENRS